MFYLENTTGIDIHVGHNGERLLFPAGEIVAIDDENVAKDFVRRLERPPSPKTGPVAWPLKMVSKPKDAPKVSYSFLAPVEELTPEQVAARNASPHGKPRQGPPPAPQPEVQEALDKQAIANMDPDAAVKEGKKLGVYVKGMEKAVLVDALWKKGFRAKR